MKRGLCVDGELSCSLWQRWTSLQTEAKHKQQHAQQEDGEHRLLYAARLSIPHMFLFCFLSVTNNFHQREISAPITHKLILTPGISDFLVYSQSHNVYLLSLR